jgi:lysophospholipase L1-like esterase
MAFGDSFTEGQNGRALSLRAGLVDGPNAYPIKLQGLLNAEYPGQGVVVSNHGKGGEFVGDGVGRLRTELPPEHPGALLLLDGYNDLLARCQAPNGASSGCNAAITEVVAKVRECIQFSRSSGVQYTFVSTLTPPGPFAGGVADRRIAPEAIVQANSRLAPMVRAEGAVIVDPYPLFLGHEGEYVDTDGLHLRPAGYQVLAETFFAAIRTTVSTTPAFGR